jgi:phosphonoacetate hydrolase
MKIRIAMQITRSLQPPSFLCNGRRYATPRQPTLAICLDGTAPAYLENALGRDLMPNLSASLENGGRLLYARAQLPTLTNVNNASIVTGVSATRHGISGNHYLAPDGEERQLNDPEALRAETILAAAQRAGVPVLAVTAKEKLRALLGAGGVASISAERADEQTLDGLDGTSGEELLGKARPDIYDPQLSAYAIDLTLALAERLGTRLAYCSLTDYVQHKAPPGDTLVDSFYSDIDERLGQALEAGWRVGMVADHGMSAKTTLDGTPNVRYLGDALAAAGLPEARVVLPITDPYIAHHGALGSIAFVYVKPDALGAARAALAGLSGVEAVLDRAAAASAFELPEDRIGDLIVCADAPTALGKSEADHDLSEIGATLRSHGGLQEQEVPLVICDRLRKEVLPEHGLRNADLFALLLNGDADTEDRPAPAPSHRQGADLECPFCAVITSKTSNTILDQDAHVISLMHPEPATRGHALVVPRRHAADLYEIDPEDLAFTIQAAQRLALKLRDRLGAEGVNLINACRPTAWQTIFHFHLHVVPRYGGDGITPPWIPRPGDSDEIKALAAQMRS